MHNNTRIDKISDAYVLCTAAEFLDEEDRRPFGDFTVRIDNPQRFFLKLTEAILTQITIQKCGWGRVIYGSREHQGLEAPPGPIGFVKPAKYFAQKETRFIWIPHEAAELKPFLLDVADVASQIRRIA